MKDLHRGGLSREDMQELLRFLDYLLAWPQELEEQFWNELEAWEGEDRMPCMLGAERRGLDRCRLEAILEMVDAFARQLEA